MINTVVPIPGEMERYSPNNFGYTTLTYSIGLGVPTALFQNALYHTLLTY